MRVGTGYDSHRFDPERKLMLGGVEIPGVPGLTGHSDGDAVAHAVTDALLGAAAEGDIGSHFPPGDPRWRDADSMDLLGGVVALLRERGLRTINVDVTVICEAPRIGPHAAGMRARIADVLGIGSDAVSIKGKTNEGMGWIGAGEGIAVHAVALIGEEKPWTRRSTSSHRSPPG
ncbi:MAG: 2-C-methyl-D-erythritol 2,4-cyclodiphosphate synthase [Gammaproteobacteria bacterium]|nr:2-C-methyl-D-erythritol 2,4-cyclodiphosphate synthase [Gammaproteobacteria bacterium]MDE0257442.1 2-C-methyl-D-erythritol 2,4-cyclodiphosphate synthase [Gammaproteobacteria bacterium]